VFYPALFLLGATVTWLAIALLHAVVGSIRANAALSALVTAVLAVVDMEKIRVLREPLYPEDWEVARQFGFVASMVGPHILPLLLLVVVLAIVMLAASRAAGRWSSSTGQSPRSRWGGATGRLVAATLCLTSLNYLGHFNSPGNAARGAFELFGAEWLPSNPQVDYLRNGFVGGTSRTSTCRCRHERLRPRGARTHHREVRRPGTAYQSNARPARHSTTSTRSWCSASPSATHWR
jgi:hypothetical protein